MNTAYLGNNSSRRGSPIKFILAALAMTLLPVGVAAAQQPATPEAPPVVEAPAVPAPEVAAPPADTAAAPTDEEGGKGDANMSSKFSIQNIWVEGDVVAKTTLVLMVIMFAGTIYIASTKAVDQTILLGQAKKIPAFWDANTLDEGLDVLGRNNAFRNIAEGAIAQANSAQAGLGARIARGDRMSHQVGIELERVNARLQAGMAFLATVGAICPFVGLFGTVWGIVNALIRIGTSGDPSIDKVAGPVGEALIMTAIGLAVAVPAVIFYNLLGRRNKTISDAARHFAFDVDKLMASSAKA
jgi:biopolymer transport protein ExbB